MGDGGFWHNGLITGVAVEPVQQGRRRAGRHAERLYLAPPASNILPSSTAKPQRRGDRHDIEATLSSLGVNWLRTCAPTASPTWPRRCKEAMRTAEHGPQGDHRRRRMPARAPAPRPRRGCREAEARRARGAHALRRRRRGLHRRPFLHPPLRLPVADGQAQSTIRCAPIRSRTSTTLRRLRPVRRGRARRGAVPVVLSRRSTSIRNPTPLGSAAAHG